MTKADGGPAFPQSDLSGYGMGPAEVQNQGLSIRDWFAGQALVGFMANTKRPTTIAKDDADWCYVIADAMLAARGGSDDQ